MELIYHYKYYIFPVFLVSVSRTSDTKDTNILSFSYEASHNSAFLQELSNPGYQSG